MSGQVPDDVAQGGLFEQLGFGHGGAAAREMRAHAEQPVHAQHHFAEHVAQNENAQEIVAHEREDVGIWQWKNVYLSI